MTLTESIVEDAMRSVKIEIGRMKFRERFPISLFTLHSFPFPTLATLRDALLPKLLSGEISVDSVKKRLAA
jgi:hypothetical protein